MGVALDDTLSWPQIVESILLRTECQGDEAFRTWLLSKENIGYRFSPKFWRVDYNISQTLKQDDDFLVLGVGKEGVGKSTFMIQLACAVDPTFCLERILFNHKRLFSLVRTLPKGSAILLDEGAIMLHAREASTKGNIQVSKVLMMARQRCLAVFIAIPSFWDADSFIRRHRARALIEVTERGKAKFITRKGIDIILEANSRSKKPISSVKLPVSTFFHGSFNKKIPLLNDISEQSYREHKAKHFQEWLKELENASEGTPSGSIEPAGGSSTILSAGRRGGNHTFIIEPKPLLKPWEQEE